MFVDIAKNTSITGQAVHVGKYSTVGGASVVMLIALQTRVSLWDTCRRL